MSEQIDIDRVHGVAPAVLPACGGPGLDEPLTDAAPVQTGLDASEDTLRRLLEAAPDAIVIADRRGGIVFANKRCDTLFGYGCTELIGQPVAILVPPSARAAYAAMRERALAPAAAGSPAPPPAPLVMRRRDGSEFPVELVVSAVESGQGSLVCSSIRDVAERTHVELTRAWLAAIVESSGDAVVGLGTNGTIRSWNAGAERLYGYSAADAIGRPVSMLNPPELALGREQGQARIIAGDVESVREETEDLRADGTRVPVALARSPIRDAGGAIIGVARIAHDITERKRLERELRWGSEHDPLTGLFNRRRFAEELAREVTRAARYPDSVGALLLADVDSFKDVNDTLGHLAGDEVIKGVARVLTERIRTTDVLARVGGDEFAILLPHTRLDAAWLVARSLCDAVREEVTVASGRRVRTTVSVGVAPLGGGMTGEDSMAIADMAMYEAKRHGRDRAITFSRQPEHMRDQLGWAERLREALAHDHFALYAQPIVDVASGASTGIELLLRLCEPDGHIVPPRVFIGAAERFGLINEIDHWVVRTALALIAVRGDEATTYSINVSGLSMGDPGLVSMIAAELERASLDPGRLLVEVTETAAGADFDLAREFVLALRQIGCRSALDDFGTGLDSLRCLRALPVDLVKIDGELIRPLPGDESDRALVKAIIDVSHAFGVQTVAEHVTSEAALAALREIGADFAQGHHLGRPRPALTRQVSPRRSAASGR